ncbi:MAG: Hypothetical protein AJITA_00882 [Acetilactobacillus jinshanensis]
MPNHHAKPLGQYKNHQKAKREVAKFQDTLEINELTISSS